MKLKQLTKYSSAALALLSLSTGSARAAQIYWKADTVGDWDTLENWSEDWNADPVVNQFPGSGDWARMGAGTSEITVTTNVDIGGGYFWSNSGYNSVVMDGAAAPTWNSGSIYLSTPEDASVPGFTLEDGTLTIGSGRSLIIAWNNTSNALGWFVQKAGTVTIAGNVDMCVKSSTQVAYYDLESGSFSANNIRMGSGSQKYTAVFTQTDGTATVRNQIQMGNNMVDASNPDSKVIYNLDGGELTIQGSTPFVFTQTTGVDVYFDFDGGALNLPGTWDFASLTGIENSDFRVAAAAAADGDLTFTPITIDTDAYTQITIADSDPVITSITAIGGGVWELKLGGVADTGYEFRSSAILDFSPGALVEDLSQGDPGDPGTIGGTNDSVITTDGNGDATVRMMLAGPADFVRAQIPPPQTVFSENFDGTTPGSLPANWASGKNPTDNSSLTNWDLGTPANVGPVPPGVPLPSGANCVATNISGNYDDPVSDLGVAHTDIWLRSPSIDLGAATAGTLTFQQWTQIEDVPGDLDYGSIRILDADDDSELAVIEPQNIDGNTSGWEEYSMALPAAAFTATAGTIKVEFRFEGDDIDSFAGWYIDDVTLTVPGS